MKTLFEFRKTFRFGTGMKALRFSTCGFNQTPAIEFDVDGGEREVGIYIALGIGIWITLEHCFPKSWYPFYISETYGELPCGRQLSLKIHNWCIWWNLWTDQDGRFCWRYNCFHIDDLLFGKHSYKEREIDKGEFLLPMLEGIYKVSVKKFERTDSWQRWFSRKMITYEIECEGGMPHEGKGENSWDCGEDATFSMSCPGSHKLGWNELRTPYEAALYFWVDAMQTRAKYASPKWRPAKFKQYPLTVLN